MAVLICFLVLLVPTFTAVCSQPQKTFYMSFDALSKRDSISNLFEQIDAKMTIHQANYTDSSLQANFKVLNMTPQTYYNDHHQVDSYIDKYEVNVTLGIINIGERFNYEVDYNGQIKTGWAFARGILDPSYFTKKLNLNTGSINWLPGVINPLTFTQFLHIEHSEPALTSNEFDIFSKILNDQAGNKRLRQETIAQINGYYFALLKDHLNHESLISTTTINYNYSKISLSFTNLPNQVYISNNITKGLEAFFQFGLDSNTDNCTVLPREFDKQYGGLQEIISINTIRSVFKEALSKGLYDVNLDRTWEVQGFQFFMGDLGNSVNYANSVPSSDRFSVNCSYDKSKASTDLKVSRYDQHDLFVQVPQKCSVIYANNVIINIQMDVNMVVRLTAQENRLRAVVTSTGSYGEKYTSVDPKYQISSVYLAKYSITEVLNGLVGKEVFGSNYPLVYRRYPAIRLLDDYAVIFDPSEI